MYGFITSKEKFCANNDRAKIFSKMHNSQNLNSKGMQNNEHDARKDMESDT